MVSRSASKLGVTIVVMKTNSGFAFFIHQKNLPHVALEKCHGHNVLAFTESYQLSLQLREVLIIKLILQYTAFIAKFAMTWHEFQTVK